MDANSARIFSRVSLFVQIAAFLVGTGLLVTGYTVGWFNLSMCGILCWFFGNVVYGFTQWRKRLIFLVFHGMIFTFLLSRPFISMCRGAVWWYYQPETVQFALNLLWVTLLCLRLGSMLAEVFLCKDTETAPHIFPRNRGYEVYEETDFLKNLRLVALLFFLITTVFFWMVQLEKLVFIQGKEYSDIYISYTSSLPGFVFTLRDMCPYALCIFLATFPKKRWVYPVLILYVLGTVPNLIIGARNPLVLAVLFSFVYFLLRDILEGRSYWFGKTEKIAAAVLIPVALVFLSFYNYIRDGESVSMGIWESVVDLFYKQGVSFDVLCIAYEALPDLPDVVAKNYTFGPFLDYITRGSMGQFLFGTEGIGTQNSEIVALYSNSFAHSMSYVAHPGYLQGHGYGSSYLLELFADWGYLGVALGSTVLGGFMRFMTDGMKKNIFLRTVVLLGLLNLFFIPRAEATEWLSFLIKFQFWLAVGFCFLLAATFNKTYTVSCGKKVK